MISKVLPRIQPDLLHVYLAWTDIWLLTSNGDLKYQDQDILSLEELGILFNEENIHHLIDHDQLVQAVTSFKVHIENRRVTFGGTSPPSCGETDLLSESYNPQSNCNCEKSPPNKPKPTCVALHNMADAMQRVIQRPNEWKSDLFTAAKLQDAVTELILANTDIQPTPETCQPECTITPTIIAPDRRPNKGVDGNTIITNQLYPTSEQIKLCSDAKYFGVIACGAGRCDEGLARAIADSCNDILIGDYCEAADAKGLKMLQQTGAAAMSFLKLCNLAGRVSDWQFDNLAAYMIQCRVLGYFRDHSRPFLPDGIYGSRMTGLGVHRHIDIAAFHGIMTASLATGCHISEKQFMKIVDATVYINDFVDFRGDILRKQRENVILRGVRGNLCRFLDSVIGECLDSAIEVIEASETGALVVMGYCNWAILGSHHKVYEILDGVQPVTQYPACEHSSQAEKYERLLEALRPYGTLGSNGPKVSKRRVEMDKIYSACRFNPQANMAWLADATRSFLEPTVLRRIVDVVHFEWRGDLGAVNYCP
ncbi:hypothetical protein N7495_004737 [Penicillium taxi]|uniref:uncharacterized protein n=1 Tax=Penicillium taxi TaxID=168475 RepID=UPI0025453095|nr:uncharacterized protein N7495_004737 [Penicillium taxi]KAJ5899993.1 hypothetical protein N7495_004737 [Penicillium taxi]